MPAITPVDLSSLPFKVAEATDKIFIQDDAGAEFHGEIQDVLNLNSVPADVMLKSTYDTDNDGIVDNSEELQGEDGAFYLARANHSGTQAISTVTGLQTALDNKVDDSEKAAANGVATLDAAGKIPLTQLPAIFNYVGVWNATTNSPALADGTGVANQVYLVSVAGTQNLGSGAIVFAVGNLVIHNGSIWQLVPTSPTLGVTSWNGATGIVTADTSDVPESTDANYVNDDIDAALAATQAGSFPANAGNPIATQDELNAAIATVNVGLGWNSPETFADGQTLGDGTARSLSSLGYASVGAAQAAFPLATPVLQVLGDLNYTIDFIAAYCAIIAAQGTGMSEVHWGLYGKREYVINGEWPLFLPPSSSKLSDICIYDFHGQTVTQNTAAKCVFKSLPGNQTIADTWIERSLRFKNGLFRRTAGAKGDGGYAFSIGAMKRGKFENIDCQAFDKDFHLAFCLATAMIDCNSTSPKTTGYNLKSGSGLWTGGTVNNSQCNGSYFINCRHVADAAGDYGFHVQDSYDITGINLTMEGANGSLMGFYFDNDNSSTSVKNLNLITTHLEAMYTTAGIKVKGREGIFLFDNITNVKQGLLDSSSRVLIGLESTAGSLEARISNLPTCPSYQQWGAANSGNCKFDFDHVAMPGSPQTVLEAQNIAALWSDQVPTTMRLVTAL